MAHWIDDALSPEQTRRLQAVGDEEIERRLNARKLTTRNASRVMLGWRKLKAGHGFVSNPKDGSKSWQIAVGQTITLANNLKALRDVVLREFKRKDANLIAKGKQDPQTTPVDSQKGWLADHPLMWLNTIKHDVLEGRPDDYEVLGMEGKRKAGKRERDNGDDGKRTRSKQEPEPAASAEQKSELYQPPAELQQKGRYAGTCEGLHRFLARKKLWGKASKAHWDAIREWTRTKEGRDYLLSTGLHSEGVALDHINDKEHTPLWHALNCYFMPTSANCHFNKRTSEEKLRYVGHTAASVSAAFLKWYIEQANMLSVDCNKFKVEKALSGVYF